MTTLSSSQTISDEDVKAVTDVLRSSFLTQGPVVRNFESAVAQYCDASHAVAAVNATAALHVALMLLDVSPNDTVWVPAISFVATANCARFCGANVDFVDVEHDSGLISLHSLEEKLALASKANTLPKVLIVVHIAGQSVDMQKMADLCRPYNIRIVEDAAHALSGEYQGRRIGCCMYSDICVFSFHPVKPITSGEGGMLLLNEPELALRARRLIEHGIERDESKHISPYGSSWYYEQQELGFNYRLSDIHSALGLSQLKRLDDFLNRRELLANIYNERLPGIGLRPLKRHAACRSSWHLYITQCENRNIRDKLMIRLRSEGYGVNVHYLPIPDQPYYRSLAASQLSFPQAKRYSECSISLPISPRLAPRDIDNVLDICANELLL